MTVPEILMELELHTGRFPRRALQAAIEQREAITPELLRVLEAAAENPVKFAEQEKYMLLQFSMYLLAQFRDKRAYRPLVTMFGAPDETPFDLAGDTVTETLRRIFGSVYDGDPVPLHALIENDNTNEYVRNAALAAFIVLADSGQMPREEVVAYYRSLFQGKLKRDFSYVWTGLVRSVTDLPAPELLAEVRQAFAEDLVEASAADLKWMEHRLGHPEKGPRPQFALITDAIAETEWWASFHQDGSPVQPSGPAPTATPSRTVATPPVRRTKVGRNDPCPCGSGKKHKKCCGRNAPEK